MKDKRRGIEFVGIEGSGRSDIAARHDEEFADAIEAKMLVGRNPGPKALVRADRLAVADSVAKRLAERYGEKVAAVAVFGSTAREADGAFSDLEMLCVLTKGPPAEFEWLHNGLKVEVEVADWATMKERAGVVDDNWAQTQGAYVHVKPLYDPQGLFPQLSQIAQSPSKEATERAMRGIIVGDMLDRLTKVRNADPSGKTSPLPELAMLLARYGAWLVGLASRHLYGGSQTVLPEALLLPDRPKGFDDLCKTVLSGNMTDFAKLALIIERFWDGVVAWAGRRGIQVEEAKAIPF